MLKQQYKHLRFAWRQSKKYDVYGLVRSGQAGSSSQKYAGSLGHESDANTGLIYMRARYMDPVLGRFLSEDPEGDGNNWFVYCENSPSYFVDATGRASLPEELFTAQAEYEAEMGEGYTVGDFLGTKNLVQGEKQVPEFICRQLTRKFGELLGDVSRTQLRKAIGNAIEEFKKAEGLRGNDNIAISRNGVFVVDPRTGDIIGFVSDIIAFATLGD